MKPTLTDVSLFEYYNVKADSLDEIAVTYEHHNPYKRFFYHARYSAVLEALSPRPGERILDIGCGTGYYVAGIAASGATAIGVDLAPNYVKQADHYVAEALQGRGVHHTAAAEAKHLPFADSSFDRVLMTEVLEHLIDYPRALTEVSRVLKPGGCAVITTPSKYSPLNLAYHWKAHRRRYAFHEHIVELTPGKFEREMRRYFGDVRLLYANFLLPYPVDVLAEKAINARSARILAYIERTWRGLPLLRRVGWTMIGVGRKPRG